MSAPVFFFALDYFFSDTFLHLLRVVDVPIHRECCGGVAEAHLDLLGTNFLFSEKGRVRVPEGVEP